MNPLAILENVDSFLDWFEIAARFGDQDLNRHINNVAIAQYFEEARTSMRQRRFGDNETALTGGRYSFVVASFRVRYLKPISYPVTVRAGTVATRIGTTSYTLAHGLFDYGDCAALGRTVTVVCDGQTAQPIPLPEAIRSGLATIGAQDRSIVSATEEI